MPIRRVAVLGLAVAVLGGCRSPGLVLYNTRGEQRVWPYFVDQPMVLAFWNTSEIRCIEDLPGLNTLHLRESPVHLMGVVDGDRLRANRWMRTMDVRFEVVYDAERRLAKRLRVRSYPTYVFFDREGNEIARSLTIRTIANWFDRERWLRRAAGLDEPEATTSRPRPGGTTGAGG